MEEGGSEGEREGQSRREGVTVRGRESEVLCV